MNFPKDWEMRQEDFSWPIEKGFVGVSLRVFMGTYFGKFKYDDQSKRSFSCVDPISDDEWRKMHKRHLKEFKEIVKSLPNLSSGKFNNRVSVIEYGVRLIDEE